MISDLELNEEEVLTIVPAPELPAELPRGELGTNVIVTMIARVGYLFTRIGIPPFVLAHIGLEAYGVVTTAFILVSYVGISTLGISNVYIKYIAEYTARREYRKANELLSTGLTITIPLCTLIFLLLLWQWPILAVWLKIPAQMGPESKETFLVVIGVFLSGISLNAYTDVMTGVQAIAASQWIWITSYLAETVLIFLLVGMGRGIRGMAEAFLARSILNTGLSVIWTYRELPWLHVSPRLASRRAARTLFQFGGVVQLQAILSIFLASVERVAALAFVGMEAAGLMDLAKKLPNSISTVPSAFFGAFLPAASHMDAHGDEAERGRKVRQLYLDGSRYTSVVTAYFCGFMALLAKSILHVWLGKTLAYAVPLFVCFTIATHFSMLTGSGTSILRGIGRVYEEFYYLIPNLALIALFIFSSRVIRGRWDALGIGVAVSMGIILSALIFLWRAHHVLRLSWSSYISRAFAPGLCPYGVAAVIYWPVSYAVAHVSRWTGAAELLIAGLIYTIVTFALFYRLVLTASERSRVEYRLHQMMLTVRLAMRPAR